MSLLAGKHCVVVGATGIIGSHIAQAFAHQGAVVSLLGRSALQARPKLEPQLTPYTAAAAAAPAPADSPASHRFIRLDVQNPASIKEVFGSRASTQVRFQFRQQTGCVRLLSRITRWYLLTPWLWICRMWKPLVRLKFLSTVLEFHKLRS